MVETKAREEIDCKFVGISGSTLTVSDSISVRDIEQRDIQRVYVLKGSEGRKKAIIGAVIGGIAGFFIGAAAGNRIDARKREQGTFEDALTTGDSVALGAAAGGAAAGYGIGHAIGRRRIGKLLYESK